jgi:hypothetical protein
MIGIHEQQVAALLAGTMIAGAGFGSTFAGTLRALLPTAGPHQRAGLLAAFYLQSYLAFAGGRRRAIGAADRTFDRCLSLRRRHHPAGRDMDDRVAAD